MVIMHNLPAMYTNRQLGINNKSICKGMEKLSSGYKINRAADDAAGLAISEKMRLKIRGLNQGTENMQDGISWVQIGDGAMEEVQDILHRMTELSVKGANGTLSASDRAAINEEMQQLKVEINRINETTKFNELRIFSTDNEVEDPVEFSIKGITGEPDDFNIFNASYDADAGKVTYGGIVFHGTRVPWDQIDPGMVYADGDVQKFHGGTWNYQDAWGRKLTFSAREGDTVPKVTREFEITADAAGMRIDGDLIAWKDITNEAGESVNETHNVNGMWTAQYHGMTLEFEIANAFDGFEGMVRAINKGTDEKFRYRAYAQYAGSKPIQAVDADMNISNLRVSKGVAEDILKGGDYILRADESGLWLERYDRAADKRDTIAASFRTWEEMGISSWNEGDDIKTGFSYTYSDDEGVDDTYISFNYKLANVTSVDSVIDGLDGVNISYYGVKNSYMTELELDADGTNILGAVLKDGTVMDLEDELALGRDFDDSNYFVGASGLEIDNAATPPTVGLTYQNAAGDFSITYEARYDEFLQQVKDGVGSYEDLFILRKLMTNYLGYKLEPKDLKEYLGEDKITSTSKMSDTVTLDDTMLRTNGSLGYSLRDGQTYGCGKVDFSGLQTARDIWELTGSGFDSTCNTCNRHYSFKFVFDTFGGDNADGVRYRIDKSDDMNPVMEISVASMIEQGFADDPASIGQKIAEALVKIAGNGFEDHYQQYAAKDGVFYVLDERPEYQEPNVSAQFYTTPHDKNFDYRTEQTLELSSPDNGTQSITYQVDYSDYEDRIEVTMERDDANGQYVYNKDKNIYEDASLYPGATEKYNIKVSYKDAVGNVNSSATGTKTVTVGTQSFQVKTEGDIGRDDYAESLVQDMIDATKVSLSAKDYTRANIQGDEKPNLAIDSFFSPYYTASPYSKDKKIIEGIRIQKSGDVPNYLTIPRFALNTLALGLGGADCSTADACRNTIDMVSYALKSVSSKRSFFGALQNRLEHAVNSNRNVSENTTAAESRIRDTDVAKEMVSLSNNQILSQAAQSMLVQANQSNQAVLGLLGN